MVVTNLASSDFVLLYFEVLVNLLRGGDRALFGELYGCYFLCFVSMAGLACRTLRCFLGDYSSSYCFLIGDRVLL